MRANFRRGASVTAVFAVFPIVANFGIFPIFAMMAFIATSASSAFGQSVVTDVDVDGDGADDVVIIGTKGKDHVVVIDRPAVPEMIISIDRNGDDDFVDAGELNQVTFVPTTAAFGFVRIATGKGNDRVDVTFETTLALARVLAIELGSGTNECSVSAGSGAQILNGCLALDVTGGHNADAFTFDFALGALTGASVGIRANLGPGKDNVSIDLGFMAATNTVDVDVDLGKQNDDLLLKKSGAWSGTSAVTIGVEAGPGNDSVRAELRQSLADSSSLELRANLSTGNDAFETFIDAASFDVASASEASRVVLRGNGGNGRDTLLVNTALTVGSIALSGVLDVDLRGDTEDDTLAFDLDNPNALTFGALGNSLLRLRLDGGAGNDIVHTNLSNDASGIPAYDVELRGDAGDDQLTYGAMNAGGNAAINYPPRGAMLVDGGEGEDGGFAFGNAFAIDVVRLP